METNNYNNKIDAYLDSNLTEEEVQAFEKALSGDTELQKAVKNNILLREGLQHLHQEDAMRKNIRQWRTEANQEASGKRVVMRPVRNRWAAAASVLILLGVATFLWMPGRYSDSGIAANFYEDDLSGLKAATTGTDPMALGLAAFAKGDYQLAIDNLQRLPENDRAVYGLAHSYYLSGDYEASARTFRELANRDNPAFTERAEWYLALSYLAGEQTDPVPILQKIIDGQGFYSSRAQSILKKRNSFWRSLN